MDFGIIILAHLIGDFLFQKDWHAQNKKDSMWICGLHVAIYTGFHFAIIESLTSWPLWAYVAIFSSHFIIDYWSLAPKWMGLAGQKKFRDDLGPWSVFVIDATMHLLVSYVVYVSQHS